VEAKDKIGYSSRNEIRERNGKIGLIGSKRNEELNEPDKTRTGFRMTCETKWIQRIQIRQTNTLAKNMKNSCARFSVGTELTVRVTVL
jgi:hypothetical protein